MTSIAMCQSFRWLLAFVTTLILSTWLQTDETKSATTVSTPEREAVVKALQPIGTLVGEWKGVSQPKRGSNAGAWPEKAAATWKFEDSTSLVLTFESDKLYHTAVFGLADDGKSTQLTLSKLDGDPLVLSRTAAEEDSKDKFVGWTFASSSDNQPQVRANGYNLAQRLQCHRHFLQARQFIRRNDRRTRL